MTTNGSATTANMFNNFYDNAKKIPYNNKWRTDRWYFENAVNGPNRITFKPEERIKAFTDDLYRRAVVFNNNLGTVIVFERYMTIQNILYASPSKEFRDNIIKDCGCYPFNANLTTIKNEVSLFQQLISYALD